MTYPHVLTEDQTLARAQLGFSLARFGDGELRLATGGSAISQVADSHLREELQQILQGKYSMTCLTCIPRIGPDRPNWKKTWATYTAPGITRWFTSAQPYGSSFVTRPDNAPEIDHPAYWQAVRSLWTDRPALLISGTMKSLRPEDFKNAAVCVHHAVPERDAYEFIDGAEEVTLDWCAHAAQHYYGTAPIVVICAGAMGTVLAARISAKGFQALDLGHIGMFMRHAGAYSLAPEALASTAYRATLRATHAERRWGVDGRTHAQAVIDLAGPLQASSILDYGCGSGTLKARLTELGSPLKVFEYDPGLAGKDAMPKPADVVVCTDVMEHVEPEKIDAVLAHIFRLAGKGAYFNIALGKAQRILADGRNAHLSLLPPEEWLTRIADSGWGRNYINHDLRKGLTVWCAK